MPAPDPDGERDAPTTHPEPSGHTADVSIVARWVELVLLFGVAPSLLAVFMRPYLVFPAIWLLFACCLSALLLDPSFDRRQLWNVKGMRGGMRRMLLTFCVLAPPATAALLLYDPARFLELPLHRTGLWALIMLGYPIASVYPQEVAFRAFFVHRYERIMPARALVAVGAISFGYAHIIMLNWVAVIFSAVGGVLFTLTYLRTRSVLAACVEHALYGCALFTIGWGWYFYGGSLRGVQPPPPAPAAQIDGEPTVGD